MDLLNSILYCTSPIEGLGKRQLRYVADEMCADLSHTEEYDREYEILGLM